MQNVVDIKDKAGVPNHSIGVINTHGQYLSFVLENEEYCVDILSVEEIRCWEVPTLIPNSPGDIKGVINLRGKIVPVMDLREKFNVGKIQYSPTIVVIILKTTSEDKNRIVGVVVDAVSEVTNVADENISPCPDGGSSNVSKYMDGIANIQDKVVSIINVNKLLNITPHIKE